MCKLYYEYILTNKNNKVLYTGVTSDLKRRIGEHKTNLHEGFTSRYDVNKLVYYEVSNNPESAILREKQIKKGPRRRKLQLIDSFNPEWKDLYRDI